MATKYTADAKLLKALADESRLAIMELLMGGEKCGCVLLEKLKIQQPTLSHHMKILCDSGLVTSSKQGKWMHYSLSTNGCERLFALICTYTLPLTAHGE